MSFAINLKNLREQKKISQEHLGKIVGVTGANVARYEKGLSYPRIDILKKISQYFQISIDTLLNNHLNHGATPLDELNTLISPCLRLYQNEDKVYVDITNTDEHVIQEYFKDEDKNILLYENSVDPVVFPQYLLAKTNRLSYEFRKKLAASLIEDFIINKYEIQWELSFKTTEHTSVKGD